MRYELTTRPDDEAHAGDSLERLGHLMEVVRRRPYVQVWAHNGDGRSLGVYFNRGFASVGWVTNDGDSATAFDPGYAGAEGATQEFYIENGQRDEYRERDCVTKEEGVRALLDFFGRGEPPDWLHWHGG